MKRRPIVIVGSGPGGLATARSYRGHGGQAPVLLLGTERICPYRRPPLTKEFLREEVEAAELVLEPPAWFARQSIDVRLGCTVTSIDTDRVCVELDDGDVVAGESIVLATGAEPVRPRLPGFDSPDVHTVRTLTDSRQIAGAVGPGTVVVVLGTGFIGCEVAASLAMRGAKVTLVGQESAPQQNRLGQEAAARIGVWLEELGVDLRLDSEATAIRNGRVVHLADGGQLEAEVVVLGMGVAPRAEIAERSGLTIVKGAVLADSQLRAGDRVFAVGDVAYAQNSTAGRRLRIEHWGDALGQGDVAGRVLAGQDAHWRDVPGFWSTIGDRTLKYAAWGDGYETCRFERRSGDGFAVWYFRDRRCVGVLTHAADECYERGSEMIASGIGG